MNNNKANLNVLLIAYYWPPSGGGGVHRWLKMSKYLVEKGVNLFVYTPENPEFPVIDESTLNEVDGRITVVKKPIVEPYTLYKMFTGKNQNKQTYSGFINDKKSKTQQLSVWIRSNIFIPDARMLWVRPSVRFLRKYIKEQNIDTIITTGPPHSMHLIGLRLKNKNKNLRWIADFRDPWSNIDFSHRLTYSKFADKRNRSLERKVLENADKVVAISWTMSEELSALGGGDRVELITNGYDHKDFEKEESVDEIFNLVYLGSMNEDRNPKTLWDALSEMKTTHDSIYQDTNVKLIGQVDQVVTENLQSLRIEEKVTIEKFIPHTEAISRMKQASVLFLIVNKSPNAAGILTGKVFEYIGTGRPIICIGPEVGDMKRLLEAIPNAYYIHYNDTSRMVDVIVKLYTEFGITASKEANSKIAKYSRKVLAGEYYKLISNLKLRSI